MDFSLTPEQKQLVELAHSLAKNHASNPVVTWAEAGTYPWEFAKVLADHGLTGMNIPEEKGGQGLSLFDSILVLEAVGRTAPHLADAVQGTNFGAIRQLAAFGSQHVVDEVLALILAGKALATVGMSEPGAGSALASLSTRVRRHGDRVAVSGTKVFNSNGPHATHYVVWAKFGDEASTVGAVVVPADTPGFSRGKVERFISGEVHCQLNFDDCMVPADYVLVDHDGMRRMMQVFNIERLGNATRSYALGELAFNLATDHMLNRESGGKRLADLQGLQWKLADLRIKLDAAQLLLYRAALDLRDGFPDPLNTSIAKVHANEVGFQAANEALQIFGGYGFTTEYPLDYLFKRTRGWMIAGGSVEVQKNRIAREVLSRHHARD